MRTRWWNFRSDIQENHTFFWGGVILLIIAIFALLNLVIKTTMIYMRLITMILSLLISGLLSAQITQQRMLDDPKDGAGIYRPYFSDRGGRLILNL